MLMSHYLIKNSVTLHHLILLPYLRRHIIEMKHSTNRQQKYRQTTTFFQVVLDDETIISSFDLINVSPALPSSVPYSYCIS